MISLGISLVVHWLRLRTFKAGSFPDWRTNIPHASECGQKKKISLDFWALRCPVSFAPEASASLTSSYSGSDT